MKNSSHSSQGGEGVNFIPGKPQETIPSLQNRQKLPGDNGIATEASSSGGTGKISFARNPTADYNFDGRLRRTPPHQHPRLPNYNYGNYAFMAVLAGCLLSLIFMIVWGIKLCRSRSDGGNHHYQDSVTASRKPTMVIPPPPTYEEAMRVTTPIPVTALGEA